jgi:4-carboxymuconolactone decarboxylase
VTASGRRFYKAEGGNQGEAESVAQEIKDLGRKALPVLAEVGDRSQLEQLMETALREFGHSDIVINSASVRPHLPFAEMTDEDWRRVLATNLDSAFITSRNAGAGLGPLHLLPSTSPGRLSTFMVRNGLSSEVIPDGAAHFCRRKRYQCLIGTKEGVSAMARVPNVTREQVPEEFREAFDELTAETGGTIATGPGSITLNSPEMARRRNRLTGYLRYETTFPKRIQELAIITTARSMDCPYVWNAHAPAARNAGVSDALIDALRERRPLPAMAPDEAAVVNYCTEFYQTHKVSQETFQTALDQFGAQHLAELTVLMGNYAQTAFILNAFDVQLPEGATEPRLPV